MESSNATQARPTERGIENSSRSSATRRAEGHRENRHGAAIKRTVDLALGSGLIVLLTPVMLLIALAVKIDSRGPALFRQRRLGLDRQPFIVMKFRTMAADSSPALHERFIAELAATSRNGDTPCNGNGGIKKLTADPRVTTVGRFLRRTSLDELPQLFNVIGGSMSLVGPRPALEYELEHYDQRHLKRFRVRPGITGLWQVSGRNSLDFHEMLDLDVEYSENPTLATDIHILVRTPVAAIHHAA